jgi:hypothetical protein
MDKDQKLPQLSDINKLLEQTWKIYNARLGTLLGIAAIPMLILLPLLIIGLAGLFLSVVISNIFNSQGVMTLWIVLGAIVVGVTAIWSQLALIYAIGKREENPGILESYGKVRGKILPAIWISIFTGLVIGAGYLFFFIPGLIFSIWFYFSFYILVNEGLGTTAVISKSKKLVGGRWWEVFARLAFMMLVISVIAYLTGAVSGAVHASFIGSLFGFIIAPLPVIYSLLIYEDLKKTYVLPEKSPPVPEKSVS